MFQDVASIAISISENHALALYICIRGPGTLRTFCAEAGRHDIWLAALFLSAGILQVSSLLLKPRTYRQN